MNELDKIYKELIESRRNSILTTLRPSGSTNLIAGGYSMDYASLYPNVQKTYRKIRFKAIRRITKIKRLFNTSI